MLTILFFNVAQVAVSAFAVRRGGAPERTVAVLMILAAAATLMLPDDPRVSFRAVEWGGLAIDAALLAAFVGVALRADRFWPLWVAALQLVAVGIHGVRAFDPGLLPYVYAVASGKIAFPMLALLAIGTWRHHRRERAGGPERDWTDLAATG